MSKIKIQLIQGQSGQEYVSGVELQTSEGLVFPLKQGLEVWEGEQKFKNNHPEWDIKEVEVNRPFGGQKSPQLKKTA